MLPALSFIICRARLSSAFAVPAGGCHLLTLLLLRAIRCRLPLRHVPPAVSPRRFSLVLIPKISAITISPYDAALLDAALALPMPCRLRAPCFAFADAAIRRHAIHRQCQNIRISLPPVYFRYAYVACLLRHASPVGFSAPASAKICINETAP